MPKSVLFVGLVRLFDRWEQAPTLRSGDADSSKPWLCISSHVCVHIITRKRVYHHRRCISSRANVHSPHTTRGTALGLSGGSKPPPYALCHFDRGLPSGEIHAPNSTLSCHSEACRRIFFGACKLRWSVPFQDPSLTLRMTKLDLRTLFKNACVFE